MPKMPKQTNSNSYNRVSSVTYASSNMLNHKLPPGLQPITQQQFTQPPHFMSMQAGFQGQQQHSLYSGLFPFRIPSFPGNVQHHPLNWAPVPNMPPSNMRYPSNMVSNMVPTFPSNIPTFQHPPPPPPGYFKKQKPSGGEKSEVCAEEKGDSKCVSDTPAGMYSCYHHPLFRSHFEVMAALRIPINPTITAVLRLKMRKGLKPSGGVEFMKVSPNLPLIPPKPCSS